MVEDELVDAIREVNAGRKYLPKGVAKQLHENATAHLTRREDEILDLLGKGLSNRELGQVLGISEDTIKTHLKSLFRKLDVSDRAREMARRLLPDGVVLDPRAPDCMAELARSAPGGLDAVIDFSGASAAVRLATTAVRAGGRVVGVGYQPGDDPAIDMLNLVLREVNFLGSRYATRAEYGNALELVVTGALTPVISDVLPLERANEALAVFAESSPAGRVVLELPA